MAFALTMSLALALAFVFVFGMVLGFVENCRGDESRRNMAGIYFNVGYVTSKKLCRDLYKTSNIPQKI